MVVDWTYLEPYIGTKFTKAVDELAYMKSFDGETCGNVDEIGFAYAFVDCVLEPSSDEYEQGVWSALPAEDQEFLQAQYGAIVEEAESGKVYIEYYDNKEDYLKVCDYIRTKVAKMINEQESNEEEAE